MTRLSRIFWISGGVLFAAATVAIHYQVKYVMHHRETGSVQTMGRIAVGQPAPDFTLTDLSNHTVTLSDYRGHRVVLLDFWATWCGPCRMAMPDLQDLADQYGKQGLEILSVNQGEPADQVRDFIERRKYTFHVVLDGDQTAGNEYGVQAIPTLVLVDKKGIVQWIRVGYSPDEHDLKQRVEKLTQE
ncbi:MAG TPA: TlpA disulfide reductase family protein [Verrucomicrobiae bacterium]|nr:TlpA disulfide reductase family protein [Verrucomicrobiae bacterium]